MHTSIMSVVHYDSLPVYTYNLNAQLVWEYNSLHSVTNKHTYNYACTQYNIMA